MHFTLANSPFGSTATLATSALTVKPRSPRDASSARVGCEPLAIW